MLNSATDAAHKSELQQMERILESHLLRGADSLSRLLRFLVEHSLTHPDEPLKEHQIATLGLGRRPDFDPSSDSTVRVQIGRLRNRLERFYAEVGPRDPVIIEIPKGAYSVTFTYRERNAAVTPAPAPPMQAPPVVSKPRVHAGLAAAAGFAAASLIFAVALAWWAPRRAGDVSPEMQRLWKPFFNSSVPTLVIYPTRMAPGRVPDEAYTGVGEVMGAAELTRLFSLAGYNLRFRRASITSWEDAKASNLIFLGNFSQAIQIIPPTQKFMLQRVSAEGEPRVNSIVNLRPEGSEPARFGSSPTEPCCQHLTEDYALIMFSKSVGSDHYAYTLAGLTTVGTQGAVEFVCDPESMAKLKQSLPAGAGGGLPQFEAVLWVTIRGGAPIRSSIAAVYARR